MNCSKLTTITNKIRTSNPPQILLEVLSARPTLVILGATYLVFILSFSFDVITTLRNFSGGDITLGINSCEIIGIKNPEDAWYKPGEWSCNTQLSDESNLWIGRVNNISNVISVALRYRAVNVTQIQVGNITEILNTNNNNNDNDNDNDNNNNNNNNNDILDTFVEYNVDLYACFERNYCSKIGNKDKIWYPVLTKVNQKVHLSDCFDRNIRDLHLDIFGNTFQNQESFPTKSRVKSYLIFVHYNTSTNLIVHSNDNEHSSGFYQFLTISRPSTTVGDLLRPILMSITFIVAILYTYIVYQSYPNISNWLRERKWILFYFIVLILYQNPIYCIICHLKNPSGFWIFLSYTLDAFAQASFFLVWLLFSDGIRRKSFVYMFYIPKIFITLLIFLTSFGILIMQFPSVGFTSKRSSSLAAVYNWSKDTKVTFIFFSLSFLTLVIIWTIWWFSSLYLTGLSLQKVPYMSTRYLQLSFRFFCLQASFVATYYFLEYGVVVYLILRNSSPVQNQHLDNISDNINTLFRHQTLLVGKVFFLTVYSIILAFLFLPAHTINSGGDAIHTLSSIYATTEDEMELLVKERKKSILNQSTLSNIAHTKAEVYCISLAQQTLDASYEVYYDMPHRITPSGFGPANWEKHGYTFIDDIYNEIFDTYCCIIKHNLTEKIVVTFRGSCSTQHWQNNLNYSFKVIDLYSLSMPHIDDGDGLEIGHYIDLEKDGIDENDHSHHDNIRGSRLKGMTETIRDVVGATKGVVVEATTTVMDATSELLTAAVANTPGIGKTLQTNVHSGFWNSYFAVREFIHLRLREILALTPSKVIFTGHSLGGALATFAAIDFSIHSLTRINKYIRHRKISSKYSNNLNSKSNIQSKKLSDITIGMYNFGAPKVGNWKFAQLYEKHIPNSFRTVTDGDIVTGLPPLMNYFHIGTEVLIDPLGAGSIIIDPSFVERRLRTRVSTSISVHAMSVYYLGLQGIQKPRYDGTFSFDEIADIEPSIQSNPLNLLSQNKVNENNNENENENENQIELELQLQSKKNFIPLSQDSSHSTVGIEVELGNVFDWDNEFDSSNSPKWKSMLFSTNFQRNEQNDLKEIVCNHVPRRIQKDIKEQENNNNNNNNNNNRSYDSSSFSSNYSYNSKNFISHSTE